MVQMILRSRYFNTIERALFWIHTTIMFLGLLMGLFFTWYITAVLVVLHRIHVLIFNGCIVSRFQIMLGVFPDGTTFVQHFADRLFGKKLSYTQSHLTEMAIGVFAVASSALLTL